MGISHKLLPTMISINSSLAPDHNPYNFWNHCKLYFSYTYHPSRKLPSHKIYTQLADYQHKSNKEVDTSRHIFLPNLLYTCQHTWRICPSYKKHNLQGNPHTFRSPTTFLQHNLCIFFYHLFHNQNKLINIFHKYCLLKVHSPFDISHKMLHSNIWNKPLCMSHIFLTWRIYQVCIGYSF